ncbi:putative thymidylate synthase [Ralstonia phage RSF1]|uniref:thymidylate synthase n=1 Tax=Ralstonia phage RSF1 TaxID=1689679 RepID=A0A0K2QRG9_9CAUD|nr:putative thymidylate synthase [Ralstonia phage RSF1]BAS04956.1 putative thymidylate synthase [Ralstonia phage RSF1]
MKQYLDTLKEILATGDVKTDRTGTGTTSKFGGMMKFSIRHGIWPIPTTREVAYKKIAEELEWMLKGIISVDWLEDRDNKIWSAWAGPESRTIGPMYGEQWRNWTTGLTNLSGKDKENLAVMLDLAVQDAKDRHYEFTAEQAMIVFEQFLEDRSKPFEKGGSGGVDQLAYIVNELKNNPDSRRLVVNVWHAGLLPDTKKSPAANADAGRMALAPCHSMWQVNTAPMSDFEVLRYMLDQDDEGQKQYDEVFGGMRGLTHEQLESYLKMRQNDLLLRRGLIGGKEMQYDLSNDATLELSEAGLMEVEKVRGDYPCRKLSLACFARSQDVPLGTVFNVGMYSLLAHLLAEVTGMVPWEYTHFMGDYHIYHNQHEGVNKQLERTPMKPARIIVDPSLDCVEDFEAKNLQVWYESHPPIKFPRAAV